MLRTGRGVPDVVSVGGTVQDQSNTQDRSDQSVHPAIARLHAELEAARRGIDVLDELEAARRERVVAEMLSAVPDLASRAAYEAGTDGVVATIRRFAVVEDDQDESTTALWDRVVLTAVEAAAAVDGAPRDAAARTGTTTGPARTVAGRIAAAH